MTNPINELKKNTETKGTIPSNNTIALIVGSILVALGGMICATNTWYLLTDIVKFGIILTLMITFFAVSALTESVFRIHRTSNTFYMLGCVFIFFTVYAAGYYGLLGDNFDHWSSGFDYLLAGGSILMSVTMFLGLLRYSSRIYTHICGWSLLFTLIMIMNCFSLSDDEGIIIIMCYLSLLILAEQVLRKMSWTAEDGTLTHDQKIIRSFRRFIVSHFWIVSFFLLTFMILVEESILRTIWLFVMAGFALYLSFVTRFRIGYRITAGIFLLLAIEFLPFFYWHMDLWWETHLIIIGLGLIVFAAIREWKRRN